MFDVHCNMHVFAIQCRGHVFIWVSSFNGKVCCDQFQTASCLFASCLVALYTSLIHLICRKLIHGKIAVEYIKMLPTSLFKEEKCITFHF